MNNSRRIPKMSKHRTGQAVVRLNGKDHYLGRYGSKVAQEQYDTLITEWLAHGRQLPGPQSMEGRTVNEVILAYEEFGQEYYRNSPQEQVKIRLALRPLKQLYGRLMATEFGPAKLKTVRDKMLEIQTKKIKRTKQEGKKKVVWREERKSRLSRTTINQRIGIIKRMFKWAAENELLPASVFQAIASVAGLKEGRSQAKPPKKVKPVPNETVEATLPHLHRHYKAMVQIQRLSGARSGEVCRMKVEEIDRKAKVNDMTVWIYRPDQHKNRHREQQREIFLGPKAIEILKPFVEETQEGYLFSPWKAREDRYLELRKKRKTRIQPSQKNRRKQKPKRIPGDHYQVSSYYHAIQSACQKAGVTAWHPHQLRHLAATNLRSLYGVEMARILLGHSTAFTTEIYAEADRQKAMEVIAEIG